MTEQNHKPTDDWQAQSRQLLDQSLTQLDEQTLAELKQVRKQALTAKPKRALYKQTLWGAAAACLVVAVSVPLLKTPPSQPVATPNAQEFVVMLDNLELLEEMEILAALEGLADEV